MTLLHMILLYYLIWNVNCYYLYNLFHLISMNLKRSPSRYHLSYGYKAEQTQSVIYQHWMALYWTGLQFLISNYSTILYWEGLLIQSHCLYQAHLTRLYCHQVHLIYYFLLSQQNLKFKWKYSNDVHGVDSIVEGFTLLIKTIYIWSLKPLKMSWNGWIEVFGFWFWCLMQQYFSYSVAISFIGRENQRPSACLT